ncbi:hypothetical protein ACSEE7_12475 [Halomonas cupida]|uniref:hypothetical protein n=1 Tax=Halomonas cupida TaxID=44933 RepID=UPI003EF928CD
MSIDNLLKLAECISNELDLYTSVSVIHYRRFEGRPGSINVELSVMDHRSDDRIHFFYKPVAEIELLEQEVRKWLAERVGVAV